MEGGAAEAAAELSTSGNDDESMNPTLIFRMSEKETKMETLLQELVETGMGFC